MGLYTCESSESCVHRTHCTVFCSILNILLANFIVCKFVYQKYTKTEKYCIICNNKLNYTCVYKCVYMCGGSKTKRDIGPLLVRRRLTYWAGHGQNTAQKASVGHIYTYTLTHLLFWTQRQTELLACPWSHSFPSPAVHLSSYLYLSCFFSQQRPAGPPGPFLQASVHSLLFFSSFSHTLFLNLVSKGGPLTSLLSDIMKSQKKTDVSGQTVLSKFTKQTN